MGLAQAYACEHELSAADLRWLFATRTGEERRRSKGAWNAIAAALPHRRIKAVWSCGTRMFHEHNYQVALLSMSAWWTFGACQG